MEKSPINSNHNQKNKKTKKQKNKKTKEQWHAELQQKFMNIVHQMVKSECELPKEFELFYAVNISSNREGRIINAIPCLTRGVALKECGEDESVGGGKYWYTSHDEVVCPKTDSEYKYVLQYGVSLC